MSGETEEHRSGWTTDTLRAHYDAVLRERDRRFDQRFIAQEEAIRAALTSAERAVAKAEYSIEQRLTLLNELRTGVATSAELESLKKLIDLMESRMDRTEGKSQGLGSAGNIIVAVILAAGTIVGIIIGTR